MPSRAEDDPPAPDPLDGTPFRTVRFLGQGGMGLVLEAVHRELGKHFVVKVLRSELEADDRHVKRLRLEARSLAKLDSPHVVGVSDLGQTSAGATYVAMDLLRGRNLRAELAARPDGVIPVAEAITWTREVLAGLGAAHKLKIIHRDVKLDNLFVCDATESQPRRVKVLDFGIAKSLEDGAYGQTAQPQTQEGVFLGTPRYVSPEQALCKSIDARSDIYSTGLVLYQLVAGKGPFAHHKKAMDLLTAQLSEEPQAPSALAPQRLPPGLDAVILKAIAKEPARRYQCTEEFSAALEAIDLTPAPVSAQTPARLVEASLPESTIEIATLERRVASRPTPTPDPTQFLLPPRPSEAATVVPSSRVAASPRPASGVDIKRFVILVAIAAIASLALFSLLLHFYAAPR